MTINYFPKDQESLAANSPIIHISVFDADRFICAPCPGEVETNLTSIKLAGTTVTYEAGRSGLGVFLSANVRLDDLFVSADFDWRAEESAAEPSQEMIDEALKVVESIVRHPNGN